MCGICGIYTFDEAAGQNVFAHSVQHMTRMMIHRGPDDEGFWTSPDDHVQLGFRRLSILDLSQAGHQPMISHDGRSALVFNGEMYNYQALGRELEARGIVFRSTSDTEVVLEALCLWGVDALPKFNGMFGLVKQVEKRVMSCSRFTR